MSHASAAIPASNAAPRTGAHRFSAVISRIAEETAVRDGHGTPADYIPMLAGIDPRRFGMAVAEPDGTVYGVGDWRQSFSTQSIPKVFALALALSRDGERIRRGVGRERSRNPFNSLVQLEYENGIPRNPFINAGALVVTDRSQGADLALSAGFLARHGVRADGSELLTRSQAKQVNAVVLTCGTYDAAGEFAYRVGLPGKSGVGGGIIAIVPGECTLCVCSPGLDRRGNAVAGVAALDRFTTLTGLSVF